MMGLFGIAFCIGPQILMESVGMAQVRGCDEMEGVAGRRVGPNFGEVRYVFSERLQD